MTHLDNNTESHKGRHLILDKIYKIESFKAEKYSHRLQGYVDKAHHRSSMLPFK